MERIVSGPIDPCTMKTLPSIEVIHNIASYQFVINLLKRMTTKDNWNIVS